MDIYLKKLYFDTDHIVDIFLKEDYLFSWDEIQGKDMGEFIKFLRNKYNINGIKTENIEETDGGRTINVSTKKNSLSLRLNNEKTKASKANLTINDGRNDEFKVKIKNGTLNVYGEKFLDESKKIKIEKATELWKRWSGEPIRISPYLIGEFIAASSSKRFHYSPDEVFNIINNEIIPKCEMIYAKLPPDTAISILTKYGLLGLEFEGEATIFNKPIGRHKASFQITKDIFQGNWDDYDLWKKGIEPGLSFTNKPEITISSTFFEIEFFRKASEFSQEFDMALKDAIHLIYATQEKVDIIVASCEDFRKAAQKIEKKFGIEVYSPEQILSQLPIP
ncbi:MAG: hypothetical protein OIN85_03775 [Candidatus Methanoperedens sp.]|nr:hypothetical protein [Candidatus Methanoperedens sp.]